LSEYYKEDVDFEDAIQQIKEKIVVDPKGNVYHLKYGLLYKLGKLCRPHGIRIQLIREDHTF
jgi:hypothetical protein